MLPSKRKIKWKGIAFLYAVELHFCILIWNNKSKFNMLIESNFMLEPIIEVIFLAHILLKEDF